MNTTNDDPQGRPERRVSLHTPGPWRFNPRVECAGTVSADAVGLRVALICAPGTGRTSETDANANLIAAAPDLLAALIDVLGWVPNGGAWHTDAPMKSVERARAAIAKAAGVPSNA